MNKELYNVIISLLLMTTVFMLFFNYILGINFTEASIVAFLVTVVCIMGHEAMHKLYATEVCQYPSAEFKTTDFALKLSIFSIFLLGILLIVKEYIGWQIYFVPIVASPGAVMIEAAQKKKCYDNTAAVAPFYNFCVGIIGICILFYITQPQFLLNSSNLLISSLSLITYFSFALAFFNSLPLKLSGNVALDGYHAVFIDKDDKLVLGTMIMIVVTSFIVLFLTNWWVI